MNKFKHEETTKYIKDVAQYLKDKHGEVKESWLPILKMLGDQVDLYTLARDCVDKDGLMIEGKHGMYVNPLIKVQNDATIQINKIWAELGITPKNEAKLAKLIEVKDDSDDFLDSLIK